MRLSQNLVKRAEIMLRLFLANVLEDMVVTFISFIKTHVFKGATKLFFTHYTFVVIVLFTTSL